MGEQKEVEISHLTVRVILNLRKKCNCISQKTGTKNEISEIARIILFVVNKILC